MPDLKLVIDKKKILPKDMSVVDAAEAIVLKSNEAILNADIVDSINDIGVLRAANAIIQTELDAVVPQLNAIDNQIEALKTQYNNLIGERDVKITGYQSTVKRILGLISVEDKYGVDPSDLSPNATKFILVNKTTVTYEPTEMFDLAMMLTRIPELKPYCAFNIPKKIDSTAERLLGTAIQMGYMRRVESGSCSLTDTNAAVSKFSWDESLETV